MCVICKTNLGSHFWTNFEFCNVLGFLRAIYYLILRFYFKIQL